MLTMKLNNKKPTTPDLFSQVSLFGLPISNIDQDQVIKWIDERICENKKAIVNFVNAHCCNMASRNTAYKRALLRSDLLLPDGSGIAIAMKFRNERLVQNLNGTDLLPLILRYLGENKLSVYLLGGKPNVATEAGETFKALAPGLQIAGCRHGFFSAEEHDEIVEEINASGAQVLLVGLGVPNQELWLERSRERLTTTLSFGVGGLFDYYANRIPRAPRLMRKTGVEWIWRLMMEPKRMWRRYILGNPLFLWRAWHDTKSPEPVAFLERGRLSANFTQIRWWLKNRAIPIHKRILDGIVSGLGLLFLLPLFLAVAAAIKLESRGPIFFSQIRVGNRGSEFKLWKFRSMYSDAEQRRQALESSNEMAGGVIFKMRNDPRITRVGRFIRRFSIDELPQLWNVFVGDMSLVGPRPALPSEVQAYSLDARGRLLGKPGITGIWQVSGRSEIPFPQQVEMDIQYLDQACLSTDIKLLAKTIPAVISGRGAY